MAIEEKYVRRIMRNLQEFGYPVDLPTVQEAVNKIEQGQEVRGDIIAMFTKRMLEEAGLIPASE